MPASVRLLTVSVAILAFCLLAGLRLWRGRRQAGLRVLAAEPGSASTGWRRRMAEVKADARPELIIRGAPGRCAGLALGSLAFGIVGVLMLLSPPRFWLAAPAAVVGVLAFLLGLAGLGTTAYVATRPILRLYPDRLVDVRRRLTISFAEIRQIAQVSPADQPERLARWLSPQWLLLTMHDPDKYAPLERVSKRSGLSDADLTLDLSLASAADCVRAQQFIADHLVRERS